MINLTNTTWQIVEAFPDDIEDFEYALNFTSNSESYVKIAYSKTTYVGLAYIKEDGSALTAYNSSDKTWNDTAYQTILITGGADVNSDSALSTLRLIAAQTGGVEAKSYKTVDELMQDITDSIREVKGTTDKIKHKYIPEEIKKLGKSLPLYTGEYVIPISFTIDETSYQAEEGMTWEEWCDSDYNTINAKVNTNGKICDENYMNYLTTESDSTEVLSSDTIINGASYVFVYGGGSN